LAPHTINCLDLQIEKLIYGGDGLARLPADERGRGKAAFVPFVLDGERVEATLIEEKPGFARAALDRVVEASPQRVQARCPYFTRCGGCHYQHSSYEHQLEIKASILRENLRRIAKLDLSTELQIHRSQPWNYRNRTRLRVQAEPQFALGYNRFGSHELEPIEECPISSALINQAITAIWSLGRDARFDPAIREIEFFVDAGDAHLLLEVYAGSDLDTIQAQALAEQLRAAIAGVIGVVVFATPQTATKTNSKVLASAGPTALEYQTARANYRVSAGSFFQTNRYLADELVAIVTAGQSGRTALDLYAGVGLFSVLLAREFERVVAVESSPQSLADLEYNLPGNAKAIGTAVEQYLTRVGGKGRADLIVVDPPRAGLGHKVAAHLIGFRAPRLTYVSCDPATLARDLVPLFAAGYRVERAHLVDLFPQTFHIESVLHLVRDA
jgi:23S rRNA (uracil1939-C5)-methyltransferase